MATPAPSQQQVPPEKPSEEAAATQAPSQRDGGEEMKLAGDEEAAPPELKEDAAATTQAHSQHDEEPDWSTPIAEEVEDMPSVADDVYNIQKALEDQTREYLTPPQDDFWRQV